MVLSSVVFARPAYNIDISKCTVSAGKGAPSDSITISGIIDTAASYIQTPSSIIIKIECPDILTPLDVEFEVNDATFKKGKFKGIVKDGISIYTFACDSQNGKFTFSAKKVDLTGLCCPFTLTITIGSVPAQTSLIDTQVNGGKACPSLLMMGVLNSLDITNFTPKFGKTVGTDSFSVKGTFNFDGVFQMSEPFIVSLAKQSYGVDGAAFKSVNGVLSCSNAPAKGGGLVSAKFDTNTGIFTVTVKNISIEYDGEVPFGLSLFGISLSGIETANLGPKQSLSLENDLRLFNTSGTWYFTPDGYQIDTGTSGSNYYSTFNNEDTLYWYTDSNGTYLTQAELSGDFYSCVCSIPSDILVNPAQIRSGQTFVAQSGFSGDMKVWIPYDVDIDVDIDNFAGTVKITTKAGKWETVAVPTGTYTAFKIEQTFEVSAAMDVYVYDNEYGEGMETTGTFTGTYKLTYWCEPSIGIVKMIDTGSDKIAARGAGSLSDKWNDTYSLTSYFK
jgi:hypothetical protein